MRNVIFDLDGTLVDTSADMIAAANACLAAMDMGAPLDPARDAATAFAGGRAMLRLGVSRARGTWSEADVDAGYPAFLRHYSAGLCRESRLYPGAREAVAAVRAAGYAVAICTNKPAALAESLMQALCFRDDFAALIGADTLAVRKPDPAPLRAAIAAIGGDPRRSLLVGDTVTDRETGRAAGVPVALVTFGPEGRSVERFEPDALLEDFAALLPLVQRLVP
jgi:phosphoglycolate phosphatase